VVPIGIVEITEERGTRTDGRGLRIALQELLRKAELDSDVDFLREGVRVMAQQLMELEVASTSAPRSTNARRSQWRAQRLPRSNLGYARRQHRATCAACSDGGYYPALLEPRRRGERALVAVVQEAYVQA